VTSLMRKPGVRVTLSTLFQFVQDGLGVSVTPRHFYFPVPSIKSFDNKDWHACRPCGAFDFRLQEQIELLGNELLPYIKECGFSEAPVPVNGHGPQFHFNNGFFERVDAEIAYALVRQRKPQRVIEVGSGNTTLVNAAAMRKNAAEGFPGELTAIEPYPAPYLKQGLPGLTRLIQAKVQDAPFDLFLSLKAGDILFIDSSHVVAMESDVLYEMLGILPRLAPGVLIHFHDIFTPLDYPEKFVKRNLCFWGEQYMLEAFLSFNSTFKVVWAGSAMQQFHPEVLREAFPGWEGSFSRMPNDLRMFAPSLDGKNVWPCSFWITRTD
jgi:hypothetical protein